MLPMKIFGLTGLLLAAALLAAPAYNRAAAQAPAPQAQPAPPAAEAPAEPAAPEAAQVTPIDLPQRPAIILRGKAKWDEGFDAITGAFTKLRAEADRMKLEAGGKPLAVFVESDDDGFTFEAMLPLTAEPGAGVKLADGIRAGRNPGGQALKFEHRGAYDEIELTYEAIAAYLDEKGLSARDELIEEFVLEKPSSDDTELQVDIYVLLKP